MTRTVLIVGNLASNVGKTDKRTKITQDVVTAAFLEYADCRPVFSVFGNIDQSLFEAADMVSKEIKDCKPDAIIAVLDGATVIRYLVEVKKIATGPVIFVEGLNGGFSVPGFIVWTLLTHKPFWKKSSLDLLKTSDFMRELNSKSPSDVNLPYYDIKCEWHKKHPGVFSRIPNTRETTSSGSTKPDKALLDLELLCLIDSLLVSALSQPVPQIVTM